jgi:hypothetical protein
MQLRLKRDKHTEEATLGRLYLDGDRQCYTLEDQPQPDGVKIDNETRIPAGVYSVKLRTVGGMTARYAERYDFHRGMLWLQDVPNFEWIYIHVGNTDDHTSGCILVGTTYGDIKDLVVGHSVDAYRELYSKLVDAAEAGTLTITIEDEDW